MSDNEDEEQRSGFDEFIDSEDSDNDTSSEPSSRNDENEDSLNKLQSNINSGFEAINKRIDDIVSKKDSSQQSPTRDDDDLVYHKDIKQFADDIRAELNGIKMETSVRNHPKYNQIMEVLPEFLDKAPTFKALSKHPEFTKLVMDAVLHSDVYANKFGSGERSNTRKNMAIKPEGKGRIAPQAAKSDTNKSLYLTREERLKGGTSRLIDEAIKSSQRRSR